MVAKKPRNRYRKLQNELKAHYFSRITAMLIKNGYTTEESFEKCSEKWHEQLASYVKQDDKFIWDAY